ncbi:hypothetical protein [Paenibacillus tepidiphilus]|uniref:hypothetical protein n=1 Tax=Paenibacillus tepidiphilus TaxID=2608683 RepID=UPI00123B2814|nr:hypothetical protein [Paenibacillus tepidiphilus]
MAFISERIAEADREQLHSLQLKDPFTNQPLQPRRWTIDRERNAILVGLGGQGIYGGETPLLYVLVWNHHFIYLDTFKAGEGNLSTGIEMFWKVTKIEAPGELHRNHEELVDVIREALDAEGYAGRRDCVTKVNFEYIAEPVFIIGEV